MTNNSFFNDEVRFFNVTQNKRSNSIKLTVELLDNGAFDIFDGVEIGARIAMCCVAIADDETPKPINQQAKQNSKVRLSQRAAMMTSARNHVNYAFSNRDEFLKDSPEFVGRNVLTAEEISLNYFYWKMGKLSGVKFTSRKQLDENPALAVHFNEYQKQYSLWCEEADLI